MADEFSQFPDDPQALFSQVARRLLEQGDLHRLFDLRILQSRHELGLPLTLYAPLSEQDEQLVTKLEASYLDACREVGQLLLDANRPLEAWRYLRPTGEKKAFRSWLARAVPEDSNAEELIELALHEGIDPERGYAWFLARQGTCQAITELEAMQGHLSPTDLQACAAVLLRHMHDELSAAVQSALERLEATFEGTETLTQLLSRHAELLREQAPLLDVSHLAATVRFARLLTNAELLPLAIDLTDYGLLLANEDVPQEPAPFEDCYRSHRLMFRASQGHEVEEALEYFGSRAKESGDESLETMAVEIFLVLLQRTGRTQQALGEYANLVTDETVLSDFAPSLLELASGQDNWKEYFEICQSRDDVLGYVAGKLTQQTRRR